MSNQTINLDLEKSRLECPPEKIYGKGVNFKKRIRVKRDQVTWSGLLNPSRVDINLKQHIKDLTDSYIVHGFIHSEPPQVIYVDILWSSMVLHTLIFLVVKNLIY